MVIYYARVNQYYIAIIMFSYRRSNLWLLLKNAMSYSDCTMFPLVVKEKWIRTRTIFGMDGNKNIFPDSDFYHLVCVFVFILPLCSM